MRRKSPLMAALIGMLAAGAATAETYTCNFTQVGPGMTIPEIVMIQHDTRTGDVAVMDPFIKHYIGSPLAGTLKSMNNTRALFSWQLPGLKDTRGKWIQGVVFSLNIIRATGQASINATPLGDYATARGSGSCTLQ